MLRAERKIMAGIISKREERRTMAGDIPLGIFEKLVSPSVDHRCLFEGDWLTKYCEIRFPNCNCWILKKSLLCSFVNISCLNNVFDVKFLVSIFFFLVFYGNSYFRSKFKVLSHCFYTNAWNAIIMMSNR